MISPSNPQTPSTFRKVFGQEKNKDILIEFLNDLFESPEYGRILEATYLDSDIASETPNFILTHCIDQYKRPYLIEVCYISDPKAKRSPAGEEIYSKLSKGHKQAQKLRYVIIFILSYQIFPEHLEKVRTDYTAKLKKVQENFLKDFHTIIIELPKFKQEVGELRTKLDYWYYYLKYGLDKHAEAPPALVEGYPLMKRVYEALGQS